MTEAIFVDAKDKPLALDGVSPIAISEVIHDMDALANAAANPRSSKR